MELLNWTDKDLRDHIFIITSVSITKWGREVTIDGADCADVNDFLPGKNRYRLIFKDCRAVSWNEFDGEDDIEYEFLDPLHFDLGKEDYEHPAYLSDGSTELSITYKKREIYSM